MSACAVPLHNRVHEVTARIRDRSGPTRADYLARVTRGGSEQGVARERLACTNLAHGFAAAEAPDLGSYAHGAGRELFATFRAVAGDAEAGALACM